MAGGTPNVPRRSESGFILMLVVGLVALIGTALLIFIAQSQVRTEQDQIKGNASALEMARAIVLDYARMNGRLPTATTFATLTAGIKDNWGRSLYYFPSSTLTVSGAGTVASTPISVLACQGDASCSAPNTSENLAFVIVSSGLDIYSSSSPINQTTALVSSGEISAATQFKTFNPATQAGPVDDPSSATKLKRYDDQLVFGTLQGFRLVANELSKTQGDVTGAGGDLRILNSDPLPDGVCGTSYSKTLVAHGMDTGVFAWTASSLPNGLALGASTTKTAVISGVPTDDGTFSVVTSITDPNLRVTQKTFSLTISSPGWSDTGNTRTSSCASGLLGSISEKEQTNSCDATQWVTVSSSCVSTATVDRRFRGSALISAGAEDSSTDTNQTSISVGSGGAAFIISATSSTGTAANISRESSATGSTAIGVVGGTSSTYMNPGESLTFTLTGGSARTAGIEFYGFGVNASGADKVEEAIITLVNNVSGTTVATYTLSACQTDSSSVRSTFSLPDPGSEFNVIKVTAGSSPSNTDFMIRSLRTCGVGSLCLPSSATGTTCPYP
jgi:hypothetical protein